MFQAEIAILRVGQKAVKATGYVAQMKCYGWQARRMRVNLIVGEVGAPLPNVLLGEFQSMQNGSLDGRNIRQSAA